MKQSHARGYARMIAVGMVFSFGIGPVRGEEVQELPSGFPAMVRMLVIDENNVPLAHVPVRFVWRSDAEEVVESDAQGYVTSKGVSADGDVSILSNPDGFYVSEETIWVNGYRENDLGFRQFYDFSGTITVKRVRQPVRMYAKCVRTTFPAENEAVGYDLQIGDWVTPFGDGLRTDLLFTLRRVVRSPNDYWAELSVSFPRPEDGILLVPAGSRMSRLESDYEAPANGYTSRWTFVTSSSLDKVESVSPGAFNAYFRVRTVTDDAGNISKAWYGKMYGALQLGLPYLRQVDLLFTYYVNPDGSRWVEFDPARNIFDTQEPAGEVLRP